MVQTVSSRFRFAVFLVVILAALVSGRAGSFSTFEVKVTGRGAPVILIPGLSCSGAIWDSTVKYLQENYECHVLSLKGFGGTPALQPVPNPLLPKVRDEIIAYARTLGHPAIVGHSLGGILALEIAIAAPDLPRCLVVVDSVPFLAGGLGAEPDRETVKTVAETIGGRVRDMKPEDFAVTQEMVIRTMANSESDAADLTGMANRSDQMTVAQALYELGLTDLRAGLAAITCPTTVILAGTSASALPSSPGASPKNQYATLPGAKVMIFEKARHFIMYDEPQKFREVLQSALSAPQACGNALRENQTQGGV